MSGHPREWRLPLQARDRSTDLLWAIEAIRWNGVRVVAMVNDMESPLATLADFPVPPHAGTKRSVTATKSYIRSLFAGLYLTSLLAPGRLPLAC